MNYFVMNNKVVLNDMYVTWSHYSKWESRHQTLFKIQLPFYF